MLISGVAGGESTTRGFLDGWDPDTGKKLWRRYTIPAPGEPGSETWPKTGDAWTQGGGPTWRSGRADEDARGHVVQINADEFLTTDGSRGITHWKWPANGTFRAVPENPILPFIRGDGTGPDIWAASVRVFDAAVQKAYGGKRKVSWFEVFAGEA